MPPFSSTYALVTGANRGLGLEWTRQLARRVNRLFATCRHPDAAHELQEIADTHSDTLDVFALDVTSPDAIHQAVRRIQRDAGSLDLLVNNAGISGGGTSDRFGTVDAETMMQVLRVNAAGPHLLTQACTELLRNEPKDDVSVVINVTSQLGSIARTSSGGWNSYKASKAALNMCTRLQAAALKDDGVIVVSMHPGWVRTHMGGSNARLSTEESVDGMIEVAEALTPADTGRFLAYDGAEIEW